MLIGVQHNKIVDCWNAVAPLLQKAIDRSQHDFELEDIFDRLLTRDMQLWVWVEEKITACCVTQIVNYPRKKVCQVPFISGSMMKHWLDCDEVVAAWAKTNGCVQFEGYCRDGWLRVLSPRGWFKTWVTMRKDI